MCLTRRGLAIVIAAMMLFESAAVQTFGQVAVDIPASLQPQPLAAGDHKLNLIVDKRKRSALVHVPPNYDPEKPMPVVLALHGAGMTGRLMVTTCGLNETADKKGFIVVYPSGTGYGPLLTWNAGGFSDELESRVDDVAFLDKLLDEVSGVCSVDPKRIYACGLSNGGMMCYRLAAELSSRIAAIAPVGGTMPDRDANPKRPVSVIHFHGTLDTLVPYDVGREKSPYFLRLKSVEQSAQAWRVINGCDEQPTKTEVLSDEGEELKVISKTYGHGNEGAEVVMVTVEGGGHTWPGQKPPIAFVGKSTISVSANELLWTFFEKHPMK